MSYCKFCLIYELSRGYLLCLFSGVPLTVIITDIRGTSTVSISLSIESSLCIQVGITKICYSSDYTLQEIHKSSPICCEQRGKIVDETMSALQWRHIERDGVSNHRLLFLAQSFVQAQIRENIKTRCCWPLWGEYTGDRWIPLTKDQ